MSESVAKHGGEMVERSGQSGNDEDPLGRLKELIERARRLELDEQPRPPHDDPLRRLEARIERARRQQHGEGAEALRRLEDRIERARWIPEPQPYQPPEGDPLERLKATIRGDSFDERRGERRSDEQREQTPVKPQRAVEQPGPQPGRGAAPEPAPGGGSGERQHRLGEALESSLRARPLPGKVRAELAGRLADMLAAEESQQLRELWELVVFGDAGR